MTWSKYSSIYSLDVYVLLVVCHPSVSGGGTSREKVTLIRMSKVSDELHCANVQFSLLTVKELKLIQKIYTAHT